MNINQKVRWKRDRGPRVLGKLDIEGNLSYVDADHCVSRDEVGVVIEARLHKYKFGIVKHVRVDFDRDRIGWCSSDDFDVVV